VTELGAAMALAREALDRSETACIGVAEVRREVAEIKRAVRKGNIWTGTLVTLGVAVVGTLGQIQVASIGAAAQRTSKATAERTIERDDGFADRVALRAAETAVARVQEQAARENERRLAELRRDMESRIDRRTIRE
jgi:hypothetical protein